MNIHEYEDSLDYKIAVMQAAKEGKPVEYSLFGKGYDPNPNPSWSWGVYFYRIAKPKIASGHFLPKKEEPAKPKTIKDWLMELPDGYRDLAIKNFDEGSLNLTTSSDVADALLGAFDWAASPQGHDFWEQVYKWCAGEATLPPLPGPTPKTLEERVGNLEALIKKIQTEIKSQ